MNTKPKLVVLRPISTYILVGKFMEQLTALGG
jgi:hypothetical protein